MRETTNKKHHKTYININNHDNMQTNDMNHNKRARLRGRKCTEAQNRYPSAAECLLSTKHSQFARVFEGSEAKTSVFIMKKGDPQSQPSDAPLPIAYQDQQNF